MAAESTTTTVAQTPVPEVSEKTPICTTTKTPAEVTPDAPTTPAHPAAETPASETEKPTDEQKEAVQEEKEKPPATSTEADEATPVVDAAPATAIDAKPAGPVWPSLAETHPLAKLQSRLPELLATAEYADIWGITLSAGTPIPFHTTLILQKFLRANYNDVDKAYNQLFETLKWRKKYNPAAATDEIFSQGKFDGLGYITTIKTKDGHEKIVTWNIYGACKDPKKTFTDIDGFLRWRIALMELSIKALNLPSATEPIPDFNPSNPGLALDPYQMIQLHDYQNVSFFRMDSSTRAASKKTIDVMVNYYPELLSAKLLVNVSAVMGWVITAMNFLSKETLRKFKVISSGKSVVHELGGDVPAAYGGKGEDLKLVGQSPKLKADAGSSNSSLPEKKKSKADLKAEAKREKGEKKKAEKEKRENKDDKSLPLTPITTSTSNEIIPEPVVESSPVSAPADQTITTIPEAKEEEEGKPDEGEKVETTEAVTRDDAESEPAKVDDTTTVPATAAAASVDPADVSSELAIVETAELPVTEEAPAVVAVASPEEKKQEEGEQAAAAVASPEEKKQEEGEQAVTAVASPEEKKKEEGEQAADQVNTVEKHGEDNSTETVVAVAASSVEASE